MRKEDTPLLPPKDVEAEISIDQSARIAKRKLQIACIFSLTFMVAEIIGGYLAGSLAIMTDAAHLLSDVAGFLISLFAIWMTSLPPSSRMTFGYRRAEVIGAILSVLIIWVLTGCLVYAAVESLLEDISPNPKERVNGKLMFIVACIGLLVNLILMKVLGHDHDHDHGHGGHSHDHSHHSNDHGHAHKSENINVQAAYIHALGDFVQSIGVCIAGALIWYDRSWQIADPIATFLFSLVVLATTVGIIRKSIHVLMEGTPDGIDPDEIENGLNDLPSVSATYDLHIWSLGIGVPSLSVHVVSQTHELALHEVEEYLVSKGILHSTIQVESEMKAYYKCGSNDCGRKYPCRRPSST